MKVNEEAVLSILLEVLFPEFCFAMGLTSVVDVNITLKVYESIPTSGMPYLHLC